ncbi:MAG: hypothetical protein P8O70_11880 [SAR324 cluster bacterium]|nr:hypothetical protein [SAR324 cluster bacterium]
METPSFGSKQQLALEFLVDVERAFVVVDEEVGVAAHQQSSQCGMIMCTNHD